MIPSTERSPSESINASPIFSPLSSASVSPLATPPRLDIKFLPVAINDRQIDNVIFDLGDVLFTWSADTNTSISSKTLRKMLLSTTWFEYEKGNLSEEETYGLIATEFSLNPSEVATAFCTARGSLQSNYSMISLLQELKGSSGIRLFAMSNISAPDWEILRRKGCPEDWALFDHVFTSAAARERKPNLGYFRHVLESTGIDPHRTAFVDDKLENVVSAQSFGLRGIIFTSFDKVARQLKTLVRNPIIDGLQYLRDHAKQMKSVTNSGVIIEDNLAQLLILEVIRDPSLVDCVKCPRLTNFFKSGNDITTDSFPDDIDTTAIACTILDHFSPEMKNDIMDEILTFRNKDGIVLAYFDVTRPRIDPIVCVNVLTFFYSNGRGGELQEDFNWVYDVLKNRAYTNGTLYYYGPDTFFYFLSRLLSVSTYARQRLGLLFTKRIAERFGTEGDALALAMRIHAATIVSLCDREDYKRLAEMQEADGSWPLGWVFRFGTRGMLIGNKGLTTALAVSAMQCYKELEGRLPMHSSDYVDLLH